MTLVVKKKRNVTKTLGRPINPQFRVRVEKLMGSNPNRLYTIGGVAKRFGTNRATITRVMNELLVEGKIAALYQETKTLYIATGK